MLARVRSKILLKYGIWIGCVLLLGLIGGLCLLKQPSRTRSTPKEPEEQYQLARELYAGKRGAQDVAQAVVLFEQAAAAGHAGAQLKLGVLRELGIGCAQDTAAAADWYFKAASQGHPAAQMQLGILLSRTLLNQSEAPSIALGTNFVTIPDYEKAAHWLHAAAEQDYAPAQQLLGDLLRISYTKNGTNTQWMAGLYGGSAKWMVKAAEAGLPDAPLKAAKIYGGDMNYTAYWYYVAQRQGIQEANYPLETLGRSLGPAEKAKGQRLMEKMATSKASDQWLEWHELIYLNNPGPGILVPADSTNRYAVLRASAAGGSVDTQFNLALTLQHEEVRLQGRVPVLRQSDFQTIPASETGVARLVESTQWYQRAAEKGHPDAQFHLASILRYGLAGAEDFVTAQKWFEAAAKAGHREAQYQLAIMLDEGFAGTAKPEEATSWFQKAAGAGHVEARQALTQRATLTGLAKARPEAPRRSARLAILALQPELKVEADLLLVSLSQQAGVVLVERSEIERVLQEQGLAAAHANDYVKLGQLLQADGLLILEAAGTGSKKTLGTRLVATGPGVIMGESQVLLPLTDSSGWSHNLAVQFTPFWSKLTVNARDAVPVSLLNLRSAISLSEDPVLDRQLTVFLKHRLLRQPELFVLERSRMEQLIREKDLTGQEGQKFWGGSYLLEGVLNRDGVKGGELSINLRLTSPNKKITEFARTGSSSQPEKLLNELADKVVAELVRSGGRLEWSPKAEARKYFEEAKWAYGQNLFPEAEQASEAAWALGMRSVELVQIRIQAYAQEAAGLPVLRWQESDSSGELPMIISEERLEKIILALSLYSQQIKGPVFQKGVENVSSEWLTMGGGLIHISALSLASYARVSPELRAPQLAQLTRLRQSCRTLIQTLMPAFARMEEKGRNNFLKNVVMGNALFQEDMPTAVGQMRNLVLSGIYRQAWEVNPGGKFVLAVWDGDPKGRETLYKSYRKIFDELLKDEHSTVREDVLFGRMMAAVTPYEFEDYYRPLCTQLWEQRENYTATAHLKSLWTQLSRELARRDDGGTLTAPLKQLVAEQTGLDAKLQEVFAKHEQIQRDAAFRERVEANRKQQAETMAKMKQEREKNKMTPAQLRALWESRPQQSVEAEPTPATAPVPEGGRRLTLGRVTQKGSLALDKFWMPPVRFTGETNDVLTTILAVDAYEDDIILDVSRQAEGLRSRNWLRLHPANQQMEVLTPPGKLKAEMLSGYQEMERRSRNGKVVRLDDQLIRLSRNGLLRYSLATKKWDTIPMALPEYCNLLAVSPRLLAYNREGIYQIDLTAGSFKILASIRRRPSENPVDELPNLEMGEACPLGADHVVFNLNWNRLFLLNVPQRHWSELTPPVNFNRQLKPLGDSILFGLRGNFGLGGFDRMMAPGGGTFPFVEVNASGQPSIQTVLNNTGEGMPRWFLAIDREKSSIAFSGQDTFSMDVVVNNQSLVACVRAEGFVTGSAREAAQNIGQLFVCYRGLVEPVKLIPQVPEVPVAALRYGSTKSVSLCFTKTYLAMMPDTGAGIWLVPADRVEQSAMKAREALKQKVQQQLVVQPVHPWLMKVRDEKVPY